jgi:hypothetical protein
MKYFIFMWAVGKSGICKALFLVFDVGDVRSDTCAASGMCELVLGCGPYR